MYDQKSPIAIQSLFNSIAHRYDLTNAVLSFFLHKLWNRIFIQHICQKSFPHILLDLCSGTGDIAFRYLQSAPHNCHAYLIDFSAKMLEQAKSKASKLNLYSKHTLSYIEADIQHVPLASQFADCITMAYGIRNVQNPHACILEISRLLQPGGHFGILELTRPYNRLLRWGHSLYLKTALPFLGKCLTDNQQAYQYLCQSITTFISPEELKQLFLKNGFTEIKSYSLCGGIATIITGRKANS